MKLHILYEDNEVVVVDKPAGVLVHSDGREAESLVDGFLSLYPQAREVGEKEFAKDGTELVRGGVVHRLDRETSGAVLFAKTEESFQNLKKQFQEHSIKKVYHAFLYGELKEKEGTIDRPIGRSNKDFRMYSAQRGARGELRPAQTDYKVLLTKDGYSFVELYPKTGRTHQLRVHCKAIHYPIVADSLYAPKRENSLGFSRVALHAYRIGWQDLQGVFHEVTAPYPADFEEALKLLQS